MNTWHLSIDEKSRLVFTDAMAQSHVGVVPVRAFPISAPQEGISILSPEGHELLWIPQPDALPEATRQVLSTALAAKDFMPALQRIVAVSGFTMPSTWSVETDRGPTELILKGEEDIRRFANGMLLIADRHGVNYLIRDLDRLDRHSRKLLDRFL